ncbi:MAG: glucose-6-phosphate isomerase [Actinomycetales bacterium]|nr:glucose-6-phosphate isomerase [Actinomycetales bacterium]
MGKVTDTPQWHTLEQAAQQVRRTHMRDIAADPGRGRTVASGAGLHLDWSRQRVSAEVLAGLLELARACGLHQRVEAMFTGERINATEKRAVLHTALRAAPGKHVIVDGVDCVALASATRAAMATFTDAVLSGAARGCTGAQFTDVVNIGIGGSDLGPVMVAEALRDQVTGLRPHFISNIDPTDAFETLRGLNPETTLVLIASKTFTTAETMANARLVRQWLVDGLPAASDVGQHLVALSTAVGLASDFGVLPERVFGFWDWVGGRYSVASAIGLSVMLAVGVDTFEELLAGMRAMDEHFLAAPSGENLPVLMGLLGVWNRDFLDIPTRAVLPYEQYLHRLPAYLQQLTMESNGKSVGLDGTPVTVQTAPILWGEPGTNGQHSFHQLIHQGTQAVACDVIVFARSRHDAAGQHLTLLANALAQAQVMALGRSATELAEAGVAADLIAHKVMPGNRPCTLISAPMLTAHALGALIALYEHATFVEGVIWGINSFDQWGVEYGKEVATALVPLLQGDRAAADVPEFTQASVELLRSMQ